MNVTYYNRPAVAGAYSIEGVFDIIKMQLKDKLSITEYDCSLRWRRLYSLLEAGRYQSDVNHITGDTNHLALALKGNRTILTLHDLRHFEEDLSGLKKELFGFFKLQWPLQKVRIITTISHCTRRRLLNQFSINQRKVRVVHNPAPVDFAFHQQKVKKEKLWILQIGSAPHKNLDLLIKAVAGTDFRLLLIRKKDDRIRKQLERAGITYEWHEHISRNKVYECYKKCDILFFASQVEGFGVPILEANAVGRPVVTSDRSPMTEVAGDSALLVHPNNVRALRSGLLKMKQNPGYRQELVRAGRKNLQRFAPAVIASQYLRLYREVYQSHG